MIDVIGEFSFFSWYKSLTSDRVSLCQAYDLQLYNILMGLSNEPTAKLDKCNNYPGENYFGTVEQTSSAVTFCITR